MYMLLSQMPRELLLNPLRQGKPPRRSGRNRGRSNSERDPLLQRQLVTQRSADPRAEQCPSSRVKIQTQTRKMDGETHTISRVPNQCFQLAHVSLSSCSQRAGINAVQTNVCVGPACPRQYPTLAGKCRISTTPQDVYQNQVDG